MKVFLTGASSGIGEALARRYAAHGATLGLVARRADVMSRLVETLAPPAAGSHQLYALDVTDTSALHAAAERFMADVGVPDIVIACAGISVGTLTEHAEDLHQFRRIFDVNVIAMAATFQPFITPMRARRAVDPRARLRLVGIGSVAGVRGLPGSEAYSASKAAVISYCESLRLELRAAGIRVVTVAPGFIATPMTARNPYKMPFLMPVDLFAERAIHVIDGGASYRVIPWQMGLVAKALRAMPNWLYDLAFSRAPHKPRQTGAQADDARQRARGPGSP